MEHADWCTMRFCRLILVFLVMCCEPRPAGIVETVSHRNPGFQKMTPAKSHCMEELRRILFPANSLYLDATGKPGSGFHEGNWAWLGHFQQCQGLHNSKYCLSKIDTHFNNIPALNQSSIHIQWGLCALQNCSSQDLQENMPEIFNRSLGVKGMVPNNVEVFCSRPVPVDWSFHIAIGVCLALVIFCLVGTVLGWYHRYRLHRQPRLIHRIDSHGSHSISTVSTPGGEERELEEEEEGEEEEGANEGAAAGSSIGVPDSIQIWDRPPNQHYISRVYQIEPNAISQFFQCFSLVNSLHKLFRAPKSERTIGCLNGLRVISILWIMLGHTFLGAFASNILDNPLQALNYTKRVSFQPVANAYYAVDTFFFLSGLLIAFLTFQHLEKHSGSFPWCRFYLHRFIRLTPNVALTTLIWMKIVPYLGEGPLWYNVTSDTTCDRYWWTNFLYIQNFYPTSMPDACMGWTWYLALDMQFYVISPIILIALYRCRNKGVLLAVVLLLGSFLTKVLLIWAFGINTNLTKMVMHNDVQGQESYESKVYGKPYCRIAPYLVGLVLGYILQQDQANRRNMNKWFVVAMWLFSFIIGSFTIFGLYPTFHGTDLSMAEDIIYSTLGPFAWALAVGWVVYACRHGYGGYISDLLSWSGWVPLSRLTYAVYLVHPLVMFTFNNSQEATFHLTDLAIGMRFCGFVLISYCGALILMLAVELPVAALETLTYRKEQ